MTVYGYARVSTSEQDTRGQVAALAQQNLTIAGEMVVAQYNTPWTVPFMRRNELRVPVQ